MSKSNHHHTSPTTQLLPLILLILALGIAAFIGYAAYTIATDIADKTSQKMEKKNVSFGKDGVRIGVKEVKTESYVDQTQRYVDSFWDISFLFRWFDWVGVWVGRRGCG